LTVNLLASNFVSTTSERYAKKGGLQVVMITGPKATARGIASFR